MITQYEFKTKFQISLNTLKFSDYSDYSEYSEYSEFSEYSVVKNSRIGCNIKIPKEWQKNERKATALRS